ncbi:MAG: hypothetical protein K1X35_14505 [Caulobacteraceae bacterium]|nr:hypothetical protein [Caulobacteraceae bacterium]
MTFSTGRPDPAAARSAPRAQVSNPFDPSDPAAPGYDLRHPAYATALAEADSHFARACRGQLERETARFRNWAAAYRRRGEGGCSRGEAVPFEPADPRALLARAARVVGRRLQRRASPVGRFSAALAAAEAGADALQAVLVEARDALDRGERAAAAQALRAETLTLALRASVAELSAAFAPASKPAEAPGEPGSERRPGLGRFRPGRRIAPTGPGARGDPA